MRAYTRHICANYTLASISVAAVAPGDYADAYFSLKQSLETLFGRAVDLVTAPSVVNPYLRDSINATRQPLYAA